MNTTIRTALVTGASRGLGFELSRTLARRGARVAMVARGREELERAVTRVRAEGGDAVALAFDVADKDATFALAGRAHALLGEIDALVHNASTLGPTPLRSLLETACEDLAEVLETNLVGPFRLSKAILGPMVLRRRGLLVHVSSDAAVSAYPDWGAYGVSKAALDHLSRSWAAELAESGVRVLSVDPGEMDTVMHAAAMPDADRSSLARPAIVAARLADVMDRAADFENGARIELARVDLSSLEPSKGAETSRAVSS